MEGNEPTEAGAPEAVKSPRPLAAPVSARSRYRRTYGTMQVGSVLGRTFSIYARNALAFSLISFVVHLPLLLYTWTSFGGLLLTTRDQYEAFMLRLGLWGIAYLFGGIVLAAIAAGPVTYGVVEQLRGGRPGVVACVTRGFARMPRILGVSAILAFFVFLAAVLAYVVVQGLVASLPPIVGTIVVLIPAFAILSVFWVAIPVAVIEDGSRGALARSSTLTSHSFWKIFSLFVLFAALSQGADYAMGAIAAKATTPDAIRNMLCVKVLLLALVFGPLQAVACAIGYHDLRTTAEGVGAEDLARVFE